MQIWIYSVVLLMPVLWTGRCLQGLMANLPCRGSCAGSLVSFAVLAPVAWRLWFADSPAAKALAAELTLPKDWSFFETTAGTLVMGGGVFAVVAAGLFLAARWLR